MEYKFSNTLRPTIVHKFTSQKFPLDNVEVQRDKKSPHFQLYVEIKHVSESVYQNSAFSLLPHHLELLQKLDLANLRQSCENKKAY